ncbi:MAG: biosynthetic-type acetolactate synthase large subunit [Verrucomicrobiota bacterium]|nr:biosynthetic-type acetolactate synthase large subunit [Verrucomicrobiota bacterium]
MRGCDILVAALEREGVEVIFAYPGGASMELHQGLTRSKKIRTILPRHEQGGVFAAEGYARATGKVGVCMATSGPGATNLLTGIADAFMDSVPIIAITGQVPQHMIGRGAFQETDIFGMTLPIVKHSYLITDISDIPRVVKEAFYIAKSGRPGPVLIDIPKNIQQSYAQPIWPDKVDLRGYKVPSEIDEVALNEVAGLISRAKKPIIYCGGGVISSNASKELTQFAELTKINVATTIMGVGSIPEDHALSLKWLGMHGTVYANNAVNEADLILAIGVRFDDRVCGKFQEFAKNATIVHIDIDPSEVNKNKFAHLPIIGDLKLALQKLNKIVRPGNYQEWNDQIAEWKRKYPLSYHITEEVLHSPYITDFLKGNSGQVILPQMVIEMLSDITKGEAIITTGVGQHQMWAGQHYCYKHPRTYITSAGLGSMGYGFPAAMGAKVGCPDKQVIDIDGDGSFLMNIQELATAHIENIAAKVIILNNQHLGMVVQWEDHLYGSNRGHTFLGDPKDRKRVYPDYIGIAQSFGVKAERVIFKKDLKPAIERMLASKEVYILDVLVPFSEHVFPFIPGGSTYKEIITDMDEHGNKVQPNLKKSVEPKK